jgi:hypothetical protein
MGKKPSSTFSGFSVFTPWTRRFTDEHERELSDTRALFDEVRALHEESAYADPEELYRVGGDVYRCISNDTIPDAIEDALCQAIAELLQLEPHIFFFPEWKEPLSLQEGVDLRRFLHSKKHFLSRPEYRIYLIDAMSSMLRNVVENTPNTLAPSPFVIPLLYTLPNPAEIVHNIFATVGGERYINAGLFVELCKRYLLNVAEISGIADLEKPGGKILKSPTKAKLPLNEFHQFLKGTPFQPLLHTPIPLKFSYEDRFSHMHIVGGSNAGKTTLLQNLILYDLQKDDPPALVIVDSQGDLINKISHLALFDDKLKDRLILITPKEIDHPPALNIFDVKRERFATYDKVMKEQVSAGVIETFEYLFDGLLGADLTAKQDVFFKYVARLLLALPETMGRNATILDMIALMEDSEPYRKAIQSLPDIQRTFFEKDFGKKSFYQTKDQIRYRLQAIIENPTIARLFTSPETKVDLFTELNSGSIILVDTAADFLKGASANYGRIFISLVLQAVLERAVIPEDERKPAFLIVDEAAEYFDSNVSHLLTQARKYRLGCVFAHQYLDQCTSDLKSSLAANTAIKFAGGVSKNDAGSMAPDMRTTADFIMSQPRLHFAAHIRNVTPHAVSIPVPVGELERQPKLSNAAYDALRARNRARVSLPRPVGGDNVTFAEVPDSGRSPPKPSQPIRPPAEPENDPSAPSEEW